jgi:spore germination protein GerM
MRKPLGLCLLVLGPALAVACAAPEEPVADTMQVRVVFTRDEQPQPVLREVPRTADPLEAALQALLRGPTEPERQQGITSWFSPRTAGLLDRVTLDEDGNALVDFADFRTLIPGASSAAGSLALLRELNGTVFQFTSVRTVDYRIEGSCETFWHFLQADCTVVERRDAGLP